MCHLCPAHTMHNIIHYSYFCIPVSFDIGDASLLTSIKEGRKAAWEAMAMNTWSMVMVISIPNHCLNI